MAIRNVQPFHRGIGGPDQEATNWPLRPSPYNSRIEDQEIDFEGGSSEDGPTNYQFVAFRPGFSLQASELNEMQEHAQLQLTLTINMYHNWITSGQTSLWDQFNPNSVGGEGGLNVGGVSETSIGQGGGYSSSGQVSHDPAYAVTAPGWKGACPLHPFSSPYQGTQIADGSPITAQLRSGNRLRVSFWPGWWLTEVRRPWSGIGAGPADVSGLKHWVYLDIGTDVEADPLFYTDIYLDSLQGQEAVVGLITNSNYYECCPEDQGTFETPCDPTLADNATGVPNSAACGATRYGVYFSRATHAAPDPSSGNWTDTTTPTDSDEFNQREGMAPVCKVDPQQRTVRYMNNILLATF